MPGWKEQEWVDAPVCQLQLEPFEPIHTTSRLHIIETHFSFGGKKLRTLETNGNLSLRYVLVVREQATVQEGGREASRSNQNGAFRTTYSRHTVSMESDEMLSSRAHP